MYHFSIQPNLMKKPLVFVIEGPDCMGKTVLAKQLAITLKAAYFHATAKGTLQVAQIDYMRNILYNVKTCVTITGVDVVMDRFWPSEVCYGPVVRPFGRCITLPGLVSSSRQPFPSQEIFARLQELDPVYIWCISPWKQAEKRYLENVDGSHPYPIDKYQEIYENYSKLAQKMLDDGVAGTVYSIEKSGNNLQQYVDTLIKDYAQEA
jgi:hypothetical protein